MAFTIVQKPSPNFWQGRNGEQVKAICLHGTGSPQKPLQPGIEDIDGVFANPNYQASTHFAIGRDGSIHQYVDVKNAAWGNGPLNNPTMTINWIAECVNKGINPNNLTVSVETKNDGSNSLPLTDIQYQALLWLVKGLLVQFPNIPIDHTGLIRHADLDSVTRARCPGPNFPMEKLLQDLKTVPADSWLAPTGFEMNAEYGFYPYWKTHGGLPIFGYPITGAYYDPGVNAIVQYTERARLENHAKSGRVEDVQLGLVGKELLAKD